MIGGQKLSNFKIEGPKLQNNENKGTKIAIKCFNYELLENICSHLCIVRLNTKLISRKFKPKNLRSHIPTPPQN
jgi:hypothetical protein